jgi:hypothetical protein
MFRPVWSSSGVFKIITEETAVLLYRCFWSLLYGPLHVVASCFACYVMLRVHLANVQFTLLTLVPME